MSKERTTEKVTVRKSNKSVKSAVMLFGAVLITTSLLGGVLAKYTSDIGTATDTGRVAHWGITKQSKTDLNLFETQYAGNKDADPKADGITVKSIDDKTRVFAPGTSAGEVIIYPIMDTNELAAVETAFKIEFTGTAEYVGTDLDYWKVFRDISVNPDPTADKINWWPLRFEVYKANATGDYVVPIYEGFTALQAPGGTAIADGGEQFKGLTDAIEKHTSDIIFPGDSNKQDKINKSGLLIKWEWPFDREDLGPTMVETVDYWDTQLGNKFKDDINPEFKLEFSYDVVQVD